MTQGMFDWQVAIDVPTEEENAEPYLARRVVYLTPEMNDRLRWYSADKDVSISTLFREFAEGLLYDHDREVEEWEQREGLSDG